MDKLDIKNFYQLSTMQSNIYNSYLLNKEDTVFHQQMSYTVEYNIDVTKLLEVTQKVVELHDVLRTVFVVVNGKPM